MLLSKLSRLLILGGCYPTQAENSNYETYAISPSDAELGPKAGYGLTIDKYWLRMLQPPDLDYYYPVQIAKDFSNPIDSNTPIIKSLAIAVPLDACKPLINEHSKKFYKDKIVLAIRGGCSFAEKGLSIQNAGGIAGLIYDNDPESNMLINMGNDDENTGAKVSIGLFAMFHDDGKAIYDEYMKQKRLIEHSYQTDRIKKEEKWRQNQNQKKHLERGKKGAKPKPNDENTDQTIPLSKSSPRFNEKDTADIDQEYEHHKDDINLEFGYKMDEKSVDNQLSRLFICQMPLNVTNAYLHQPPWRIWHDEL